jgi:uncharacterized protein (TIGR00251 family)
MITPHSNGAVLEVWVVPGVTRDQLVGPHGHALKVRVAAPAESGKANEALLRQLKGAFGVKVELLTGSGSRSKRVLLLGVTPDEARQKLTTIYNEVASS